MEQATAPTTITPAPRTDPFRHVLDVAGAIVPFLKQPLLAVEFDRDETASFGWSVHLKYGQQRAAGIFEFAELIDVPVTRATTELGVHLDATSLIRGVEVRGSAFTNVLEAARLECLPCPQELTETPGDEQPAAAAVLSSSPLAELPALVSVLPAPVVNPGSEDEARCVRCACTENAACEGGCYWVSNLQMVELCSACATVEELAAITYTQGQPQEPPAEVPAQRLASPLMHRIPVVPAPETDQ